MAAKPDSNGSTGRQHVPLNVGKVSSIGDVGTIRTQLQHRKDQLSKEIGVEQQITKGTKKLSKMPVLNKKTRDQASLEHDFSVSKIQLLRSELTKINSSLQAYQPESTHSTQIPLIPLTLKTTSRISFAAPLSNVAEKHYYIDPILVQDAIYDFQELRYSIASAPKDETGVTILFEYLSHLSLLSKRFIHPKIPHGISFVWHDAINGTPAIQQSAIFEKACVTFNIAALYTQIAAKKTGSAQTLTLALNDIMTEKPPSMRIGHGFDIHRLEGVDIAKQGCVIGGVKFEGFAKGTIAHSDGDVLYHSLTDAILGAIGKPDIGQLFPDNEKRWKGVSSEVFVLEAVRLMREAKYEIANVDVTLILQEPKVSPFKERMMANLSQVLSVSRDRDRGSKEGIEASISYLEKALGVIEYMKHNFSHSPTMDMTPEVLSFFSDLIRAQAVELQWDVLVLEGLNETDIQTLVEYSQRTKTISECYRPLRELVEEPPFKEYIPPAWSAIIKIKDAHYKAVAHYYAAVVHDKMYKVCSDGLNDENIEAHRASITTELHFLYTADTTNIEELFSPDPKHQMGLVKSHLNCAAVLHDYALKFKSVSKELGPITVLTKLLESAGARTQNMKEKVSDKESVAMISPTVQPSIIDLEPVIPSFTKEKVQDTFKAIGPLQKFCPDYSWSPPRKLTISKKVTGGYGFSVRGSKPVRISSVRENDDRGLVVGDWIIRVNGKDTRWLAHADVVSLVQSSPNDLLEVEVITPTESAASTAKPIGETPTSKEPPTEM